MKALLSLSASPVLFHFTRIDNATNILVGKAKLTPTVIGSDQIVNSQYFLSLTRSRVGRYHRMDLEGVLFELNGTRLAQRYKIRPVDYWQMRQTPKMRHDSNEMEERLMSDKPELDIKPYITRICVLSDPRAPLKPYAVRVFKMYGRKLGVPVEFYTDPKHFQTGNVTKQVAGSDIVRPKAEVKKRWPRADRRADSIFGNALRLLRATSNPDFDMYKNIYDLNLDRRFCDYVTSYQRDLKPQLDAAFHNAARSKGKDRVALDRLLAEMRLFRITTPQQLAAYFIDRYDSDWKKSRQQTAVDDGW